MARILIVDDETEFLELARIWLQTAGFDVVTAKDGAEGLRRFYSTRPDLVILDANMPGMDGWEVCRRIRDLSEVPIVMATVNGQKSDMLRGFGMGLDDYIVKPVDLHELAARVRAILRRVDVSRQDNEPATVLDGQLEIDWRSRQVYVRGQRVRLSPTEFRLLSCLIRNRGWIVPHEQLLEKAWGPNYIADKSFVKLYIRYLRQKIERDPQNPTMILTERGVGYRFAATEKETARDFSWPGNSTPVLPGSDA